MWYGADSLFLYSDNVFFFIQNRTVSWTNVISQYFYSVIKKEKIEWLFSLHWRHNDHDGVSNHQPHGCLLNRLFRRRSKKTSKLRVTGFCVGNLPGPVNSPHKGPVTRKMLPFDDVIILTISELAGGLAPSDAVKVVILARAYMRHMFDTGKPFVRRIHRSPRTVMGK